MPRRIARAGYRRHGHPSSRCAGEQAPAIVDLQHAPAVIDHRDAARQRLEDRRLHHFALPQRVLRQPSFEGAGQDFPDQSSIGSDVVCQRLVIDRAKRKRAKDVAFANQRNGHTGAEHGLARGRIGRAFGRDMPRSTRGFAGPTGAAPQPRLSGGRRASRRSSSTEA